MPNDQINKVSGVHKDIAMTGEQSTPRLKSETQFHGRTGNQKNSLGPQSDLARVITLTQSKRSIREVNATPLTMCIII